MFWDKFIIFGLKYFFGIFFSLISERYNYAATEFLKLIEAKEFRCARYNPLGGIVNTLKHTIVHINVLDLSNSRLLI